MLQCALSVACNDCVGKVVRIPCHSAPNPRSINRRPDDRLTRLIPRAQPLLGPASLLKGARAPEQRRQGVGQQLVALVAPGGADMIGRGREGGLAGDARLGAGLLALCLICFGVFFVCRGWVGVGGN